MYHKYFFWFDSRHTTPKIIKNFVNLFYWLTSQVNCFPLWICSFFNFKIKITFWKTIYSFNIFVTTVLLQSLDFSVLENFCEINSRVQAGLGAGTLHFHNKPMRLLFRVRPEKWLFMSCFIFELSDLNIDALFIIYIYIYKFINIYKCIIYNIYIKFPKNLLLYKIVSSNVIGARMQKLHSSFFFYMLFLSQTLMIERTAGEGKRPYLVLSTISTHSRTFRHLFAALNLRWPPLIFIRNECNYHVFTRQNFSTSGNKNLIKH